MEIEKAVQVQNCIVEKKSVFFGFIFCESAEKEMQQNNQGLITNYIYDLWSGRSLTSESYQ